MTNKEFKEMLSTMHRLIELLDKFDSEFKERDGSEPFLIPSEIYDEICDRIKQSHITLFGVS